MTGQVTEKALAVSKKMVDVFGALPQPWDRMKQYETNY